MSTSGSPAPVNGYPAGATPVSVTSGVVQNAVANAQMPAVAGKTNWITGFDITGAGATAGLAVTAVLTGLAGGTLNYIVVAATGVTLANETVVVLFDPPLPSSAQNTPVRIQVPALGLGNTASAANIRGFVL